MTYRVNEVFHSLQGEGVRAGTSNVFVRFSGCNLKCSRGTEGFDCDTEFASGVSFELLPLVEEVVRVAGPCRSVIFTGGEPGLQLTAELVVVLKGRGFFLAIETNGTQALPHGIDWVVVSPKTAEHTLRVEVCDELRYVRHAGQGIPKPYCDSQYLCLSPAVQPDGNVRRDDLRHCIELVKMNPPWRLSLQLHKLAYGGVR